MAASRIATVSRPTGRADRCSGRVHALAYAVDYQLDLFSNFTYFTDHENGDQFEQFDDRRVYGGELAWRAAVAS